MGDYSWNGIGGLYSGGSVVQKISKEWNFAVEIICFDKCSIVYSRDCNKVRSTLKGIKIRCVNEQASIRSGISVLEDEEEKSMREGIGKVKYNLILLMVIIIHLLSCPVSARADAASYWYEEGAVDYYVEITAPDGGANLRLGPGVKYQILLDGLMPNGTVLHVSSESMASNGNYWGYTEYNGIYGWVALTQVTVTDNPAVEAVEEVPAAPLPESAAPTQDPTIEVTATPSPTLTLTPTPIATQSAVPTESEQPEIVTEVTETPVPVPTSTHKTIEKPDETGLSSSMLVTLLIIGIVVLVVALTVFIVVLVKYKSKK